MYNVSLTKFYCTNLWWVSINNRESLIFQHHDINIDSDPHFGKGKIQEGVDKKTHWLEKTRAVQLLNLKYPSEAAQTNFSFKNIKIYRFCASLHLTFIWQDYWIVHKYHSKLMSPEGLTFVGAPRKISKSGCLLCFKWPSHNYFVNNRFIFGEIYMFLY